MVMSIRPVRLRPMTVSRANQAPWGQSDLGRPTHLHSSILHSPHHWVSFRFHFEFLTESRIVGIKIASPNDATSKSSLFGSHFSTNNLLRTGAMGGMGPMGHAGHPAFAGQRLSEFNAFSDFAKLTKVGPNGPAANPKIASYMKSAFSLVSNNSQDGIEYEVNSKPTPPSAQKSNRGSFPNSYSGNYSKESKSNNNHFREGKDSSRNHGSSKQQQQQSSQSSPPLNSGSKSSNGNDSKSGNGNNSKPELNPACLPRCNSDELMKVDAKLETKELWEKFHELGTEMIITKTGRR